jgi:hypothetical protein
MNRGSNIKRYPCQADMKLYTIIRNTPKEMRKGLNSLIILVAGEVWTFGNTCVFEGISPNIQSLLQKVVDQCSS